MHRITYYLLIATILLSFQSTAQLDSVYIKGDVKVGKIFLNAQNSYFSSFKLISNDKSLWINLEEVDSVTFNRTRYVVKTFEIADNDYTALTKIFFQGEYALAITWSDKLGEVYLKVQDDRSDLITEANTRSLLEGSLNYDWQGFKLSMQSLLIVAMSYHEQNLIPFNLTNSKRGKQLVKNSYLGVRLNIGNRNTVLELNNRDYKQSEFTSSLAIFYRLSGERFFFEPSIEFVSVESNADSLNPITPQRAVTQQHISHLEIGADFGIYLLKNPKFQPYITLGWFRPIDAGYENTIVSDNPFNSYTLKNSEYSYDISPGIGIQSSTRHMSFMIGMTYYHLRAVSAIQNKYVSQVYSSLFNRTFEENITDNIGGRYADQGLKFEFSLALKISGK